MQAGGRGHRAVCALCVKGAWRMNRSNFIIGFEGEEARRLCNQINPRLAKGPRPAALSCKGPCDCGGVGVGCGEIRNREGQQGKSKVMKEASDVALLRLTPSPLLLPFLPLTAPLHALPHTHPPKHDHEATLKAFLTCWPPFLAFSWLH